ncbi:MAG: Xaa-Pro dipeptidyl-peptidase, partial [Planctomycetota bacterium]|nr:Xaa-Pro dipeptidyl-peptidase [Planctomycetota bacterium]
MNLQAFASHKPLQAISFSVMALLLGWGSLSLAQESSNESDKAVPRFEDGQAQVVEAFQDPTQWIREDLWVETEFDTDGDGELDRMHVSVCRQKQTESEGLKVAAVYVSSPYFTGTGSNDRQFFWDPKNEVGESPKERPIPPPIKARIRRPLISMSHIMDWV